MSDPEKEGGTTTATPSGLATFLDHLQEDLQSIVDNIDLLVPDANLQNLIEDAWQVTIKEKRFDRMKDTLLEKEDNLRLQGLEGKELELKVLIFETARASLKNELSKAKERLSAAIPEPVKDVANRIYHLQWWDIANSILGSMGRQRGFLMLTQLEKPRTE